MNPMTGRSASMPPWAVIGSAAGIVVIVWIAGQTLGRVIFVFLVSVVIALLLNPLVRLLRKVHVPRGLAVATVFLSFIGAVAAAVVLLIPPISNQIQAIRGNLPLYTDQAQRQVQNLQAFFERNGINVDVQAKADSALQAIKSWASGIGGNAVSYSLSALSVLILVIIVLVASVYMLLDAPRIAKFAQRIGGPSAAQFLRRTEHTLVQYVKAQTLVSLIIGVSAGLVLWIFGVTGLFPQGATYAALFAAWVFVMEFIPYIGPILGAVPPLLLALFTSPITALWVLIAFVVIHQFEGHVVVPQVMGDAVGVHPLVVIFGILIGEELYGIPGIILAIPVVVILKETVVYASERMGWFNMSLPPDDPLVTQDDQVTSSGFTPPARRGPGQQGDGDTMDVPTRVIEATNPTGAE